jgi:peptidoglycan hydrolase CwlO-like protein
MGVRHMATIDGGSQPLAVPEKFQALEGKIQQTAALVAQLRAEKRHLERQHQAAEQRIAELEGEVKRLGAEREAIASTTDDLLERKQLERKYQEGTADRGAGGGGQAPPRRTTRPAPFRGGAPAPTGYPPG